MSDLDYSCSLQEQTTASAAAPARCGPINSAALSNKKPATNAQYLGHLDNQLTIIARLNYSYQYNNAVVY